MWHVRGRRNDLQAASGAAVTIVLARAAWIYGSIKARNAFITT